MSEPEIQPYLDPELEARIVAWVLGEASDFEAAELERLVKEQPELGLLKQRMEAVHCLVTAAHRPGGAPERMSDERRATLMEALGQGTTPNENLVAMPASQERRITPVVLKIAAGIAALLVPAVLLLSISGQASHKVQPGSEAARELQEALRTEPGGVLLPSSPARAIGNAFPAQQNTASGGQLAALDALKTQAGRGNGRAGGTPTGGKGSAQENEVVTTKSAQRAEIRFQLGESAVSVPGLAVDDQKARSSPNSIVAGTMNFGMPASGPAFADLSDANETKIEGTGSGSAGGSGGGGAGGFASSGNAVRAGVFGARVNYGAPVTTADPRTLGLNTPAGAANSSSEKLTPAVIAKLFASAGDAPLLQQPTPPTLDTKEEPAMTFSDQVSQQSSSSSHQGYNNGTASATPAGRNEDAEMFPDNAARAQMPETAQIPILSGAAPADDFKVEEPGLAASAKAHDPEADANMSRDKVEQVKELFAAARANEKSGRYDEAYKTYDKILNLDPYSVAARQGQDGINSHRDHYAQEAYSETRSDLLWQVDTGWQSPVPGYSFSGNKDANGATATEKKLDQIIVPKVEFRDATVKEALAYLQQKSRDLDTTEVDPSKRGVTVVDAFDADSSAVPAAAAIPAAPELQSAATAAIPGLDAAPATPAAAAAGTPREARITLSLKDVPLGEALKYVSNLAGLKEHVDANGVKLEPPVVNTEDLITKVYKTPPGFMSVSPEVGGNPLAAPAESAANSDVATGSSAIAQRQSAREFLTRNGVTFPTGANAVYFPETNRLIVRNTPENIELIDASVDSEVTPATEQKPAAAQIPSQVTHDVVPILGDIPVLGKAYRASAILAPMITMGEIDASQQPYSTFSLHVSDASFQLAREALAAGRLPDGDSIRAEEFYNAFEYGDAAPAQGEDVACHTEQAVHPELQGRDLVRIAARVAATGRGAGQPLRLTVMLDTSGSMAREDRVASMRQAMKVLGDLLGPDDAVTLVGFSRHARLLAEDLHGDDAGRAALSGLVSRTPSEGGTNMEEALKLAGEMALRHQKPGAQNRVVMVTDGAANLGDADPAELAQQVEGLRQKGISFDACGVGIEGLNDGVLETLTRKGGGRYYILNKPEDADQGFARQLAGAFHPAAENVKLQVHFNPARVKTYRLIGFEKHILKQEDFRNDAVTAAQLAAEEAGVALYQVQPNPEGEGELGEVFVRFRDPASGKQIERSWSIPYDAHAPAMDKASPTMQLAAVSSMLAERLQGGPSAGLIDLEPLAPLVANVREAFPDQEHVQQLSTMYYEARRLMPRH